MKNSRKLESLLSNITKPLASHQMEVIKNLGEDLGITVSEWDYPILISSEGVEHAPRVIIANSIAISSIIQIEIFTPKTLKIYYEYYEFGIRKETSNVVEQPIKIIEHEKMHIKPYGIILKEFFQYALVKKV